MLECSIECSIVIRVGQNTHSPVEEQVLGERRWHW